MTYEEAIKMLSRLAQIRSDGYYDYLANGGKADDSFDNEMMAFDKAIEALEKQMPKKPKLKKVTSTLTASVCPNCGSIVHHAYCPDCGQAMDWGENEET